MTGAFIVGGFIALIAAVATIRTASGEELILPPSEAAEVQSFRYLATLFACVSV